MRHKVVRPRQAQSPNTSDAKPNDSNAAERKNWADSMIGKLSFVGEGIRGKAYSATRDTEPASFAKFARRFIGFRFGSAADVAPFLRAWCRVECRRPFVDNLRSPR